MKKLLGLICILLSLPVYANYEFCSDKLESGCVDYQQYSLDCIKTFKRNGQYFIKAFPKKGNGMPISEIPYGNDREGMYRDFNFNIEKILKDNGKNLSATEIWYLYDYTLVESKVTF